MLVDIWLSCKHHMPRRKKCFQMKVKTGHKGVKLDCIFYFHHANRFCKSKHFIMIERSIVTVLRA